jgi:hypothetical protein
VRVEVRVHGGFAGIRRPPVVLDTAELEPALAREIEALAGALPAGRGRPERGADYLHYDVLVVDASRSWTASFSDPEVPEQVRALLRLAREARGGG